MHRYTIIITPDSEDGRFVVTVPALPGCFTWGDTIDQAIAHARDAIAVHIAGLAEAGEPVPDGPGEAEIAIVEVA